MLRQTKKNKKNIITNEFKDLRFKNVDFSYQNTGTPVLKNINFELNKNECIGIMGKSGEENYICGHNARFVEATKWRNFN